MKTYIQTLIVFFLFISCSKDVEPEVIPKYNLKVSITPTEGGTVTPSEGSYPNETTVSLLATPSPEYIFKEWTGGITGTSNPVSVTMSSNKNISVIFEKRKYPLSIIIEGEGTVTEELLSSKSTSDYPSGSVVKLTAVPIDGWKFVEWIGDYEGTDNPINITVDKVKSITVKFEIDCDLLKYPLVNLKLPSYFTNILYHPKNISEILRSYDPLDGGYGYGTEKISIDYNRDGFLDFVSFYNDYGIENNRNYIKFFKGDCNGDMILDEVNSNKFLGMVHGRKIIYGDYNDDDYPDIFLIGHGWDKSPFPGEYPVMLLSDGNGNYKENRMTDIIGFYHGGSSGDYDNDGDLDIVLVTGTGSQSILLENDGYGNFTDNTSILPIENNFLDAKYSSEFFDLNKDGNLELFLFGGEGNDNDWKFIPTSFIVGNGVDFGGEIQSLPEVKLWELVLDMDFFDIDSNGSIEIILNRTKPNYQGWYIQIIEIVNDEFVDSTDKFIEDYYSENQSWNVWLDISDYDNDGVIELRNSINPELNLQFYLEWELINGKFVKINN